jgi:GPCR proteolysis site, GPS, motif
MYAIVERIFALLSSVTSKTEVSCICHHLTNFAIIFDIRKEAFRNFLYFILANEILELH